MSLARAKKHRPVVVQGVRGRGPIASRLMEMGLVCGTPVEVIGYAPLGDPIQIRVGDYSLSIRSSEAELVDIAAV